MSDQYNFIHIPKTGGTAIKYALEDYSRPNITFPDRGHSLKLSGVTNNACFVIRQPWLRFCSAYWERATMEERRRISENKDVKTFGYANLSADEKRLLEKYTTPDELVTFLREGGRLTGILGELTAPQTVWLGELPQYKKHEHKVKLVFALKDLDKTMKNIFGMFLTRDPFKQRSRKLFDKQQSYDISPVNKDWFEQHRKHEYELLDYIRTREYFYE